jgi:tetratricopeptide (TPR) repeat protein
VLQHIAEIRHLTGLDLQGALEAAELSRELRSEVHDHIGTAHSLMAMGSIYSSLGHESNAQEALAEALQIVKRCGHRVGECRAYLEIMAMYGRLDDSVGAEDAAQRGLSLARELDHNVYLGRFLDCLASLAMQRREYPAADALQREALQIQAQTGILTSSPLPLILRSYSAWKMDRFEESQSHIVVALRTVVEHNDGCGAAHVLLFLAQVLAAQGSLPRAVELEATACAVSGWAPTLADTKIFIDPLAELTAACAPVLAEAARDRGRAGAVLEVAAELLDEVQSPYWRWR